ncbi:GDSL-type esterase/lipase family protein [Hymenobacter sp. BT635]|uniref:GDSL-type esterase/lipase family protein n=1 Tax=Hymenobacter nitidus TaxID=2880929 RepID=A0ABS8AC88_9BACT|nr:GDSL-type esterase/lipase family protein [Hymenobacter nitidus]MCB2378018.1 GDSL-type esterase/lipase family protein [Hymenobacter nitidus]
MHPIAYPPRFFSARSAPWQWLILLGLFALIPRFSLAQVRIMPFGASTTQGSETQNSYRRALWHKLEAGGYSVDFVGSLRTNYGGPPPIPDFDFDHEGHWGLRADELMAGSRAWAAASRPDVVLIHAGSNDAFQNQNVVDIRNELGQIIDELRLGQPTVKVILAQLLPTSLSPGNSNITELNALLPGLAQQKSTSQSPVVIVDQNTGFNPGTDMYDGVHLNDGGEEKMAARWYAALQSLLGPPPPPVYALTVATTGSGTVARSPELTSYPSGGNVTLTATPAAGYLFLGWSGDAGGTANPLTITMNSAKSITANFASAMISSFTLVNADTDQDIQTLTNGATLNLTSLPTRNLNVRVNTNPSTVGSVRLRLDGAEQHGQTESVAPYALFSDAGGNYNSWTPIVGTYRLEATAYSEAGGNGAASAPLAVNFTVIDQVSTDIYSLTVSTTGQGTVSKSPEKPAYAQNESVVLTATPASGYLFLGWSGDAGGTANPLALTMTGNKAVTATFAPAPTDEPGAASFTLVNATTDRDIQTLTNGSTLNLALLPTRNLNIRANYDPAAVGRVVFELSGAQMHSSTESVAPFALFSDAQGDYFGWVPAVGSYILTATPYAATSNGTVGAAGPPLTLRFSVVNTAPITVAGFTLVDADTDKDIQVLTPGLTVNFISLPTRNLNIRANTIPATVGSVVFTLNGKQLHQQTESVAPYALFSDSNSDYNAWAPSVGTYSLTATPYEQAGGSGPAGQALTISFILIDQAEARPAGGGKETGLGIAAPQAVRAHPNPSEDGRYVLDVPRQQTPEPISYTLLSALGATVATGQVTGSAPSGEFHLDFSRYMPAAGIYYLLLESPHFTSRVKLIRR